MDERGTRLYLVIGRLDRFFPEISARISCGGSFVPIEPSLVLEGVDSGFPAEWSGKVIHQLPELPKPPSAHFAGVRSFLGGLLRRCGMKFAGNRPVKIVMLGAGGTGGHIAPHLYRLLYALERPVRFIICDGDIVEEKNLVRQNFTPADLGENKAKVLAERYSSVFGMETEYVPEFIESGERLLSMLQAQTFSTGPYWGSPTVKELVILIGAVDNNKSRKLCHEVFYKLDDLIYIDSGNGMHTGQIVCGIRSGGRTFYRPVGAAFPEVLQVTDKFPTEQSCAEASVSAPQSIAANITAATAVVGMIYNILTVGETRVRQITFATGSVNMRATLQKSRKKAA